MARRITLAFIAVISLLLAACASAPRAADQVTLNPNFDGIYRLTFSNSGQSLYYRFYDDGVVLSARTDAPADEVMSTLTLENAETSRGSWTAAGSELRIGVDEGTVRYDSSFDLRSKGRIALRGLPRTFDFIPLNVVAGR